MPLDFRYHLASLTAVFAALLIGILFGVTITHAGRLSKRIQDLRTEFQRSQVLRVIDQRTDRFNQRTQPLLVRNRLTDRNVLLVQDAVVFPDDEVSPVRETLEASGAHVTAILSLKPALLQLTPTQMLSIARRLGEPALHPARVEYLLARLTKDVGRRDGRMLAALQQEHLVRVKGDITQPVSIVVLMGGMVGKQKDSVQRLDVPFLRGCQARQLRVAAVEAFEMPRSAIADYRKAIPLTVDNIDRVAGRTALVLALSGRHNGHFGYKDTADDVAPDFE